MGHQHICFHYSRVLLQCCVSRLALENHRLIIAKSFHISLEKQNRKKKDTTSNCFFSPKDGKNRTGAKLGHVSFVFIQVKVSDTSCLKSKTSFIWVNFMNFSPRNMKQHKVFNIRDVFEP